jgi:hypothetical protein
MKPLVVALCACCLFAGCLVSTFNKVGGDGGGGGTGGAGHGGGGGAAGGGGTGQAGMIATGGSGGDVAGAGGVDAGTAGGGAGAGGSAGVVDAGTAGAAGGSAGTAGSGAGGVDAGAAGGMGGSAGTGGVAGSTGGAGGKVDAGAGDVAVAHPCDTTTNACIANAPNGWTGPTAMVIGAGAPPACPGTFPTVGSPLFGSLNEGTPSCGCTCSAATNLSCSGSAQLWKVGNQLQCDLVSTGTPTTIPPGATCPASLANGLWKTAIPQVSGGSCTAQTTNTLPVPTWGREARTCGGAVAAPADDCAATAKCLPKPPSPYKMCITAPGAQACPAGIYATQYVLYSSFMDSRSCSACSCGSPAGSCGMVSTFSDACNGQISAGGTRGGCFTVNSGGGGAAATYTQSPQGTCVASGGALAGAVTKRDEVTYCCAP